MLILAIARQKIINNYNFDDFFLHLLLAPLRNCRTHIGLFPCCTTYSFCDFGHHHRKPLPAFLTVWGCARVLLKFVLAMLFRA